MANEVAEPPAETALPNPVLPPNAFSEAKSVFKQARIDAGLDKPAEVEPEPAADAPSAPDAAVEKKADAGKVLSAPASVLPDDILEPPDKKEPEASETIAEIEAMVLPKNAKPERVAAFNELKQRTISKLSSAEQKIQELQTKLSESTSNNETEKLREKLKAAETKYTEIEDQWAKTSLETSPRFQSKFVKREHAELEAAKAYLDGTDLPPTIIDYAARTRGAVRTKVLAEAGLSAELIGSINAHLAVYDGIQRDKAETIENWRSESTKWQEQEAQKAEAERAKIAKLDNEAWEAAVKELDILPLRKSEKDPEWNEKGEAILQKARDLFIEKGGTRKEISARMIKGVAYDDLMERIVEPLREKVKTQQALIDKLQSASPGGAITQSAGETPAVDPGKMDFLTQGKTTFNEQKRLAEQR